MMEFYLTQSYATLEEMLNSAEVAVYKEDLQRGTYKKYAIVSRIGNRYDLDGNKIKNFVDNPYFVKEDIDIPVSYCEITDKDVVEEADITVEEMLEGKTMKYFDIEEMIDKEVEKAVEEVKAKYEEELAKLKEQHAIELEKAKEDAKAELIAKLNA